MTKPRIPAPISRRVLVCSLLLFLLAVDWPSPTASPQPATAQQTQTICGLYFHNPSDILTPWLRACDGQGQFGVSRSNPNLPGPGESYVRFYDAVVDPRGTANGERGTIIAWSRFEVLGRGTCSDKCGTSPPTPPPPRPATSTSVPPPPPLIPNVSVTNISWVSPPGAYQLATLVVRGRATALPGASGNFRVRVLVDAGFLSRPLSFWYNTADPYFAKYVSPTKIVNGDFEVRVSGLRLPRIVGGRIAVWIIHNDNFDAQGALTSSLDVSTSSAGGQACFDALQAIVMSAIGLLPDTVANEVLTKPLKETIGDVDVATAFTRVNLDATEGIVNCRGDQQCQNEQLDRWRTELALQIADKIASGGGSFYLGKIAVSLKELILASPSIVNCGVWITYGMKSLAKQFNQSGWFSNLLVTGSPVYPFAAIHAEGKERLVGFLPNGQQVVEISDAQVFSVGETRFVVYPGQNSGIGIISGYAQGTMTVNAVFARSAAGGTGNGAAILFSNAPVSKGMEARLDSSDPQANLNIDTNGDGRVDQTRAPDARESITSSGASYNFPQTGFTISGRFWDVWQSGRSFDDSLYINGFPITSLRPEVSTTDGKTYQTQWFERAKFEQHPENQAPNDVLLGLLGVAAAKGRQNEAPFRPVPRPAFGMAALETNFNMAGAYQNSLQWFPETQHTLGDNSEGGRAIAHFWTQLGGIPQFGFPISQPFAERSKDDGKSYLVQYFERQRFEYHPENKGTRYEVLLGRLGAEQSSARQPTPIPQPTPAPAGRVHGPVSGEMPMTNPGPALGSIPGSQTNFSVKDFEVLVRLHNFCDGGDRRISDWHYRIYFRHQYILEITSEGKWLEFGPWSPQTPSYVAGGDLPNMNLSASGSNAIRLRVVGNAGEFFMNDRLVANLDISRNAIENPVSISAFGSCRGAFGGVVRFQDFTVRELP